MTKSFGLRFLAVSALLCLSASSYASLTVYTTQASFLAATSAQGVETFTGFNLSGPTPSPFSGSAGAYGYTASVSTTTFYGAGTTANPWLSTNTASDTITFNGFTNGAQAIGGNFFDSDFSGAFQAGSITVTATDSSASSVQTITNATTTSFLGFVSSDSLISLTVSAVQPGAPIWPTVDNLVIAQRPTSGAVPEPGSIPLVLAGVGIMGLLARRRSA